MSMLHVLTCQEQVQREALFDNLLSRLETTKNATDLGLG